MPRNRRRVGRAWQLTAALGVLSCAPTAAPVPRFDAPAARTPTAQSTLSGQVVGLGLETPEDRLSSSLRIEVRPGSENPVAVRLAPGWYLDRHGLKVGLRDEVTVTGTFERDRSVFVARSIRKGTTDVRLRDDGGRPVWPDPPAVAPEAGAVEPDQEP